MTGGPVPCLRRASDEEHISDALLATYIEVNPRNGVDRLAGHELPGDWARAMGRVRAFVGLVVASVLALIVGVLPAHAEQTSYTYRIWFTNGEGVFPRSEPVYASRVGEARAEGSTISGSCWTQGEWVTNPRDYSSNIWVKDTDALFWPEVWLDTGSEGVPAGLPQCGAEEPPDSSATVNDFFDRNATARWALAHAQDEPNPWYSSGCTWFVSNALWAGGFPQDDTWTSAGQHGTVRVVPGSVAAWSVREMLNHLTATYSVETTDLVFTENAVPQAEIGDIIAYDWEGDGTDDHLALVTKIAPGAYPEVSEWGVGEGIFGTGAAGYTTRGWTYSAKNDKWFQDYLPNIEAKLYQINGGIYVGPF